MKILIGNTGLVGQTLKKNIKFDFEYLYDNDKSDIYIFPKYKDLTTSLRQCHCLNRLLVT